MSLPLHPLRVTVIQVAAGREPAANLDRLERTWPRPGTTDLVALPEVFHVRGEDADYHAAAEPVPGPLTRRLAAVARRLDSWILMGSLIEKAGPRRYNTTVLLDRRGRVAATYRKIHLFEAHLETGQVVREHTAYSPGRQPALANVEGWRCGLAICYDVRFPELFRIYADQGAHLIFLPSNFTQRTGKDHWNVLVRARAIENQCFVVAPDQCGANPVTGIPSHGHSLVVGPWGEALWEAGRRPCAATVTLDPALLRETRRRIPALAHRRLK